MTAFVSPAFFRARLLTVLCGACLCVAAGAQEAPSNPSAPAAAALDPKLLKQFEALSVHKFSREATDVFQSLERWGAGDQARLPLLERFMVYYRGCDWPAVGGELAALPEELARRTFDKILADLTEKQKTYLRLEDVLGLADASPVALNAEELRRLGQVLSLSVPANETYWIVERLEKGTKTLGGADPAKRLLAGRMLLGGNFKDLARRFLPSAEEMAKIPDEAVRQELKAFLEARQDGESAQRELAQKTWDDGIRVLTAATGSDWDRTKAAQAVARVVYQLSPGALGPLLADLLKEKPEGALRVITHLARKFQGDSRGEPALRLDNLKTQHSVAGLLSGQVDLAAQPWGALSQLLAGLWIQEAETTFTQKSGTATERLKFIAPEDLLSSAPEGRWAESLPAPVRERLDVSLSRVILAGANFEQAAEKMLAIGKRSPRAGAALAEDFINAWAGANNPQLPEALRKKYDLPENSRIPVTPIMMEKNIQSLSAMLKMFREAGMAPRDYEKLVGAFDLAYSTTEAYSLNHIERVFGPLENMEETLFFLILSKMNANLGERWRRMDVQKAGLTKRDEAQTLAMVRGGYAAALEMIGSWVAGHPEGARALTLAGTMLSDWGDFEYFQDLVTGDPRHRTLAYREKNVEAQEYFRRGAGVYAAQVAKVGAPGYGIDAYMGWFNALLGIGSGGQINLAKAMNRSALAQIRESMLALPGGAPEAHLNQFAKAINARLLDEKEPLHENLKYRYLASALVVAKDNPFTSAAEKKVAYLDQLLNEIRLQTRLDGPSVVGRDQEFGIIVSVLHTEPIGRVAQFGQYLSNDPNAGPGRSKKKGNPMVRKLRDAQGPRDELELNFTEALSHFFEIKSFTFAPPEVKARPVPRAGWEETVLAYILVRVRDASVDKVPPLSMELRFLDLSGPVTVPVESAETLLKVGTGAAPARPVSQVEVTQTLDTRFLAINGGLSLEIKATGSGVVPELDQLVDLAALGKTAAVKNINPHEGLQVKELNTWGDAVSARTERLWSLSLDGDAFRASEKPLQFQFASLREATARGVYQTYSDVDLSVLPGPSVALGGRGGDVMGAGPGESAVPIWGWVVAGVLAVGGTAFAVGTVRRKGQPGGHTISGPGFQMPAELDGFAVAALLRRMRLGVGLRFSQEQVGELQRDLEALQRECFGAAAAAMPEAELRSLAQKWVQAASQAGTRTP